MDITSRISRFISRISPSPQRYEKANRSVAFLEERLTKRIAAHNQYHLEKIFRAGSTAKHTDLACMGKDTFDVDLGVYYRSQGYSKKHLNKLLHYTRDCLLEIYPQNKLEEDFHEGKNAINVTFRKSKLKIDVVPIVRAHSLMLKNSGSIPRQDEWRLTSISAHTDFIHKRTARSRDVYGPVTFNDLVRLMKYWNRRLPEKQCSYFCELITAAALEKNGVTGDWLSSLRRIFEYHCKNAFIKPIIFDDYYDPKSVKLPEGQVIVLDAVNPKNNLAKDWNDDIKRGYLRRIKEACDAIKRAQNFERAGKEDKVVDCLCEVFGNDFRRLSR